MEIKYHHFAEEAAFKADRNVVMGAVRAFAADWLDDWKLSETPDGFEAKGVSGGQDAIASFRITSVPDGTKVAVELRVEARSTGGFLFVNQGSYGGMIRNWLQALPWWVDQRSPMAVQPAGQTPPPKPPPLKPMAGTRFLKGCITFSFILAALYYLFSSVLGLVTGDYYLLGTGGAVTIHGPWGRVLSAIVLAFFVWIGLLAWKYRMRSGK